MSSLTPCEQDVLRFITGFELKHGRGPSATEVSDAQFGGDVAKAENVIRCLLAWRQVRRNFPSRSSKLQAIQPLPVPRSPFGEPLHFVRIGGDA